MRKLKMGMVGGGSDAFIGEVHRAAALMDGEIELVAGALSSSEEKALASGRELGLPDERNYGSWQQMFEAELGLPKEERVDFVSVVTPNHVHFPVAHAFAEAGCNVVLDKPMVHDTEQAERLVETVEKTGVVFAVTYQYTGYPMVKQARHMVRRGDLGEIRKVIVEYNQDWLAAKAEDSGVKQAEWRTDPEKAGIGGAIGDIGSHAENLISTVTGLEMSEICADLTSFVPGRALDDDANLLIRYEGGAKGVMIASQVSTGEENDLRIRIYGTEGGSSGARRSRTISPSSPSGPPLRCSKGATTTSARRPRRPRGFPQATPRPSLRRSPTSTRAWPRPYGRGKTGTSPMATGRPSPPFTTVPGVCTSSRRSSRALGGTRSGSTLVGKLPLPIPWATPATRADRNGKSVTGLTFSGASLSWRLLHGPEAGRSKLENS